MGERIEVSIVIAAWNAEESLATAIDSALAQTGLDGVEVLVVDDASTDATAEIAGRYGPPVSLHRLPMNGGPARARNAGFAMARGAWIAILDSDDRMAPERLSRMLAHARAEDAEIVIDNPAVEEAGRTARPMFGAATMARLDGISLAAFVAGNTPMRRRFTLGYIKPLFRRDFLEAHAIAHDERLRIGEDFILIADCLARGARIAVDPASGYVYSARPGSISHRLSLRRIEAMRAADRDFAARHALAPDARRAMAQRDAALATLAAFTASVEALKAGKWQAAMAALIRRPAALIHYRLPAAAAARRMGRRLFGPCRP
ncbi:MAG: glycosyltransferase family 2 protein [Pseudomonadota bacterium]